MSDRFLGKLLREVLVALHQVFDDNCHLNNELELFLFLFLRFLQFNRVLVESDVAFLFCPCKSFLILSLVINAFCHAADDLNLVNRLNAHAKIGLDEILIDDRSADAHCNGTDLQP